ncbi:uncharacterized protein F5147DRAFT_656917 [Suillus discolor]|uniref:Retrotransposon gag domain-containing protein n=1 Tax=Suillus discolor TaxID=1912936 RepID=A0A9P7EWI5_9AGAM|nr:uncharacterized protein F5147DRAFT_656917 [Suillus discolor]KAG2095266.1 hypothetical protein F5147DRAFT_656917 [Suillus discolor]
MTTIPAVVPQPSFYGDYEKEEEPTNWIRKYQLSLPPSYSDVEKISCFKLQCAAASPAEEWFANLPSTDKTTWTNFLAAFKVRWPPPAHAKLTVAQKKERLKSVVLKEEEIGVMIEKDRGRDWGHVKWAKQVAQMALGFGDTQCHFLDVVLENTPEVLRDFLADHYAMWADFEADVAKTLVSQLIRAKQRVVNDRKLREDVDKLQTQTSNSRKAPAPSPQNAQSSFPLPPVYRYGPRTRSTRQRQSPERTFSTAIEVDTHKPHQEEEDPQVQIAYERLHNTQSYHTTQTLKQGGKLTPSKSKTGALNTALEAAPNMMRPYPLKPGTSPLGSRECFNCGLATTPSHQAHECQNTPIPMQEGCWREMHPVHNSHDASTSPDNNAAVLSLVLHTSTMAIRTARHVWKCVRAATVGELPAARTQNLQVEDTETMVVSDPVQIPHNEPPSPDTTNCSISVPSTVPASPWLSSFESSLVSTPAPPSPVELSAPVEDDQVTDDEFVVPTLEIEVVSPQIAASITPNSDSLSISDSLDPSSTFSSTFSVPPLPSSTELGSVGELSNPTPTTTILDTSDTASSLDFVTDFSLSDTFIVEMTDTADCYPSVIKPEIVNLYNTSNDSEEVTESAPFTTQDNSRQSTAHTEHYVFEVGSHITTDQLDARIEYLAKAGAHVVQANQRPFVSPVTEQSSPSPCSPVIFTAANVNIETSDKPIWPVFDQHEHETLGEVPEFLNTSFQTNVYSRHANPFNPKRVAEIMRMIKIGDDLSEEQ